MSLTQSDKEKLRRHTLLLDDNRLVRAFGLDQNAQIESILGDYLPQFIENQRTKRGIAQVPVMFWAHGGNVMRSCAIKEALRYIDIWVNNGIYPIYILWDTGPLATVADALREIITPDAADHEKLALVHEVFHQTTWDKFFDEAARAVAAPDIWREMMQAAKDSNEADGGGREFVNRLATKAGALKAKIDLHAVGHSAGCIFLAHFAPLLLEKGFDVKTLQLLAPAIRIEAYATFLEKLDKLKKPEGNGHSIGNSVMFTMDEGHELKDELIGLYQDGSLLYFIRDELDTVPDPALLGLQVCFNHATDDVRNSFGQVTLTPTAIGAPTGRASGAASHTAFSSDPATLNSLAYNILGTDPTHRF